ncbi:hypothetical protein M8J77_004596 [Diaphorina citri]|nr:hypothetical protein M8J77_004596 [Diaphorina citri]
MDHKEPNMHSTFYRSAAALARNVYGEPFIADNAGHSHSDRLTDRDQTVCRPLTLRHRSVRLYQRDLASERLKDPGLRLSSYHKECFKRSYGITPALNTISKNDIGNFVPEAPKYDIVKPS